MPRGWTAGLDLYLRKRHGGRRAPGRLDVMSSFGGKGLDVVQVMLRSLADSHPADDIHFWFLYLRLKPRQIDALTRFCDMLPNVTLHLCQLPDPTGFDRLRKLGGKPDSARFLWFDAHRHLPEEVTRVIYLDALDTIVTDDLMPLLRHPFLGKRIVACRESPHAPPLLIGPARRAAERGASDWVLQRMAQGLLNSGAIVVDLARWRRDGITIDHFVEVAEWASARGLRFGDQGLYSLTFGSDYAQAHDRYNYRFWDYRPSEVIARPAVIHYTGLIRKPDGIRLSPEIEKAVRQKLRSSGRKALFLNEHLRLSPLYFRYYRRWWEICARTPVHERIAPLADARTKEVLTALGVDLPPSSQTAAAVAGTSGTV